MIYASSDENRIIIHVICEISPKHHIYVKYCSARMDIEQLVSWKVVIPHPLQ